MYVNIQRSLPVVKLCQIPFSITFAINALKHGGGASYRQLVTKINDLEFDVETPHTPVYEEGDVSAIKSLIKTDDAFILGCAELIREISVTISEQHPDFYA